MLEESAEEMACRLYKEGFAARLTEALRATSHSQSSLARSVGVYTQSTISRVMNNKRMPEAYFVVLLAKELGCNAEWLLTGEVESGLD
jgi:transcriptional regulator with XRE-family HTH domain